MCISALLYLDPHTPLQGDLNFDHLTTSYTCFVFLIIRSVRSRLLLQMCGTTRKSYLILKSPFPQVTPIISPHIGWVRTNHINALRCKGTGMTEIASQGIIIYYGREVYIYIYIYVHIYIMCVCVYIY